MKSIIEEIKALRENKALNIETNNCNRHRIHVKEKNNSVTAYCFSAPIYHKMNRQLIDLRFFSENDKYLFHGTNSEVIIEKNVVMKNGKDIVTVKFPQLLNGSLSKGGIINSIININPTLNGIMITVNDPLIKTFNLSMETNIRQLETRSNSKYFAFMSEKFVPFLSLSAIGVMMNNQIIAPVEVISSKSNNSVSITLKKSQDIKGNICFEINMYEPKLFQDTTVESKNPKENNAFGGMAFIGNTIAYGEQWLYSRPTLDKMQDFMDKYINHIKLHIPIFNKTEEKLTAHRTAVRFCSFGSNWNTKVGLSSEITESAMKTTNNFISYNYCTFDISDALINRRSGMLKTTEGLIIRKKRKDGNFAVLATGDNYSSPQILEINYKK